MRQAAARTPRARRLVRAAVACLLLAGAGACRDEPLGAASAAAAPDQGPGRLVRLPDGRRINLRCSGSGSPTVLLESGFGADSLAWNRVRRLVAPTTRVCAYDRAGAGYSDPGPMPRDGAAIARDLDRALRAAGVDGPFIVVGHSAGGLYGQVFAGRRIGETVGLVLVDSSVPHQEQRMAELGGAGAGSVAGIRARAQRCLDASQSSSAEEALTKAGCMPHNNDPHAKQVALRPATWQTQLSELDTLFGATSDQADRMSGLLQGVPAIVLTADNGGLTKPGSLWWALHEQLAERFRSHVHRSVPSSHLIMIDRPDLVSEAILELVASRRGQKAGG